MLAPVALTFPCFRPLSLPLTNLLDGPRHELGMFLLSGPARGATGRGEDSVIVASSKSGTGGACAIQCSLSTL